MNWEGDATVRKEDATIIGRFTREYKEEPVEYIFIYDIQSVNAQK